jgi:hypothetical protein
VFNALGAVAAILVCNTSGLLPEIQVGTKIIFPWIQDHGDMFI